jgi:hypothetical protein
MQDYDMANFGGSQQTRRSGSRSLDVLDVTKNSEGLYYEVSALLQWLAETFHFKKSNSQMDRTFQKV